LLEGVVFNFHSL